MFIAMLIIQVQLQKKSESNYVDELVWFALSLRRCESLYETEHDRNNLT